MNGEQPPKTSLKSRGPYVALVLLVVALCAGGLVAWRVSQQPRVEPVADTPPPAPDAGVAAAPSVDPAEGDKLIGDLVPPSWLTGGDGVRRAAAAVNAVAEGESPRAVLLVLDPGGTFIVDEQKPPSGPKPKKANKKKPVPIAPSRFFISEKNDARYDEVTRLFTSIDAAAAGRLYGKLRPYLDAAFREIARPGTTFDSAFVAAVDRLAAVPIADGPREVVPMEVGTGYAWADPKLEALGPAEKHLLRMGPKNARAVVKQLQAFRAAMNAP